LDFSGQDDRQMQDLAFNRTRPTRVPGALHQAQITLVKCEAVERSERSTLAVYIARGRLACRARGHRCSVIHSKAKMWGRCGA
jgi:hypothetical protein